MIQHKSTNPSKFPKKNNSFINNFTIHFVLLKKFPSSHQVNVLLFLVRLDQMLIFLQKYMSLFVHESFQINTTDPFKKLMLLNNLPIIKFLLEIGIFLKFANTFLNNIIKFHIKSLINHPILM